MGRRSRKRRPTGSGGAQGRAQTTTSSPPVDEPDPGARPDDAMRRGYARGRQRDDLIRAGLEPLGPGERPPALVASVVLAAVLALANFVLWVTGFEVRGEQPGVVGVVLFCGLMTAAAIGMWLKRYWAVLGWQALLAVSMVVAFLSLLQAASLLAVVVPVVVLTVCGWLFWKLIRVMSRLQMPSR
ncbi:MAG: hypothetical protein H0X56_06345 [Solirubrobacterales bacterium]|nr:hypothetical protein [Solirubrobacterales bacterium]MBA3861577.1 hypothetical protein [Solirubrobacterales bacterium]